MFRRILIILALVIMTPRDAAHDVSGTTCVSATRVAEGVIGISRYLPDEMHVYEPHGSAIFRSPTEVLVAQHEVRGFQLTDEWHEAELFRDEADGRHTFRAQLRVKRIFTRTMPASDGLALLELREPVTFPITILPLRTTPLQDGEFVMSVGYSGGSRAMVRGTYISHAWHMDWKTLRVNSRGLLASELLDGENRKAIFTGASGGPIVDCDGEDAGAISDSFSELPKTWMAHIERYLPARRREANVWAVPTFPVAPYFHAPDL